MENTANYSYAVEMTDEEKVKMYMKLSKKEIISMLLENQKHLNRFTKELDPVVWKSDDYIGVWHGINNPNTGDYLGATYKK